MVAGEEEIQAETAKLVTAIVVPICIVIIVLCIIAGYYFRKRRKQKQQEGAQDAGDKTEEPEVTPTGDL